MGSNETESNLLKINKDTDSNNNHELSTNDFNKSEEHLIYKDSSKCKKNNDFNGELENYLAVDYNTSDNILKTTKTFNNNNKSPKDNKSDGPNNEYTLKTAGLCSERCTRDFISAKNRKYHWNLSKMNENDNFNNIKRVNNEMNNNKLNRDNIFKSNCILRNENRIKNTSHSDIFGVNNENNVKRKLNSHSFNYNRSDNENNTLSNRDDENGNSLSNKNNDKIKERSEKTEIENSSEKEKEINKENKFMENENNPKNLKEEEDNLPTNMVIKLSKLKSETNEKDLIKMCNNCELKVLSISLDRNIINHNCTGTGKIVVKARKGDLVNFQNLLNSQGFKYII